MPPKIGIVSAMDRELAPLLAGWQRGLLHHQSWTFATWKSWNAVYVQSGIGREPGIMATRALVEAERPDILIAAGFAGALTRYHTVGETITPGTVIDSHTGDRFGLPWGTGVLVSSPTVADDQAKKRLAEHYSADFVDMEGASVARIGQETGVPVCAVKTISDELGFAMPPLNTYVRQDGTLAIERFAAHVAVRPGQWPNLIQLARNSRRASSALCNVLERLMRNVSQLGSSQGLKEAMQDLRMPARAVN